ncbi:hypothetical protein AGLY_014940 [Aphis glycines]|uniref:Transmembrane protein n=1 Tax=Aphis glycines TaxID=307491 RepID=A0A6G0T2L5_APHGL|nr:hypothetical protein AGLY_014940 [Aphis glycines]
MNSHSSYNNSNKFGTILGVQQNVQCKFNIPISVELHGLEIQDHKLKFQQDNATAQLRVINEYSKKNISKFSIQLYFYLPYLMKHSLNILQQYHWALGLLLLGSSKIFSASTFIFFPISIKNTEYFSSHLSSTLARKILSSNFTLTISLYLGILYVIIIDVLNLNTKIVIIVYEKRF